MVDEKALKEDGNAQELVEATLSKLDLDSTPLEELQLARVVTRKQQQITFVNYSSDQDDSDSDEEDGRLITQREYHDNGQPRVFKTLQRLMDHNGMPYERIIEEKHFDIGGVCRVDVHFAIGQPYLYRKHYWPNQRLKSESVFWVDDEVTMSCKKWGHWRTYYESGNIKTELQYRDGVRYGFCKRYAPDGAIEWVKDYTKQYLERIEHFNEKKGKVAFTIMDACNVLGFDSLPSSMREVNSQYRTKCAPVHPDKTPDPDATEEFINISRARDVLKDYFEKHEHHSQ
ncbi:Heat shock protein tDnaJ [Gracilaria domingensis]|nr:Heat shock protein tDnaJ [Gracilaria domingensis]